MRGGGGGVSIPDDVHLSQKRGGGDDVGSKRKGGEGYSLPHLTPGRSLTSPSDYVQVLLSQQQVWPYCFSLPFCPDLRLFPFS